MGWKKAALRKGNPLRSDIGWQLVLFQGSTAAGIGLYALLAETSTLRTIAFLIGLFLMVNGLSYAYAGVRQREYDPMIRFRLIRAGIGISTGLIVVLNRFADFMETNPARVIGALGLVGIGVVTVIGIVMVRDETDVRISAVASALGLSAWGGLILYQVTTNSNSSAVIGWAALIIGGALIAFAMMRRQRHLGAIPVRS